MELGGDLCCFSLYWCVVSRLDQLWSSCAVRVPPDCSEGATALSLDACVASLIWELDTIVGWAFSWSEEMPELLILDVSGICMLFYAIFEFSFFLIFLLPPCLAVS